MGVMCFEDQRDTTTEIHPESPTTSGYTPRGT